MGTCHFRLLVTIKKTKFQICEKLWLNWIFAFFFYEGLMTNATHFMLRLG